MVMQTDTSLVLDDFSAPKVSVVIPCFNQAHFLAQSVQSVLDAYAGPLEIIIVNDGSTAPNTDSLLAAAAAVSPAVRIVRQANGGLSSARNTGLACTTGEYVQFLDADDILIPPKLDLQVAHFAVASALDVSVCNFWLGDHTLTTITKHDEAIAHTDLSLHDFLYRWERGFSIPIHCALFRRASLPAAPFDVSLRAKEDWVFWSTLSAGGVRMAYLNSHSVIYRQHEGSMRRSYVKMGESWNKAAAKIDQLVRAAEPEFISSATAWFERFYAGHPSYRKELQARAEVGDGRDGNAALLDAKTDLQSDDEIVRDAEDILRAFRKREPASAEISVLVPVFNHYRHLKECLMSVASQRDARLELVCVDDASTDARVGVLLGKLRGGHPNLVVVLNSTNRGISAVQNQGVELATAPFVALLDCDDALEHDALQKVMRALSKHPDTDYLFTDRVDVDGSGKQLGVANYGGYRNIAFRSPENIRYDLLDAMVASHLKVIRRDLYLHLGGSDEKFSGVQDWHFALKAAEVAKFHYLNEPLYRHRIHSKSVTSSDVVSQFRKTNALRRSFALRWLCSGLDDRNGWKTFRDTDGRTPSLEELKNAWRDGVRCEFVLGHDTPLPVILFLREFNSYFDRIVWSDPRSYASLVGFLWGRVLVRAGSHRAR